MLQLGPVSWFPPVQNVRVRLSMTVPVVFVMQSSLGSPLQMAPCGKGTKLSRASVTHNEHPTSPATAAVAINTRSHGHSWSCGFHLPLPPVPPRWDAGTGVCQ